MYWLSLNDVLARHNYNYCIQNLHKSTSTPYWRTGVLGGTHYTRVFTSLILSLSPRLQMPTDSLKHSYVPRCCIFPTAIPTLGVIVLPLPLWRPPFRTDLDPPKKSMPRFSHNTTTTEKQTHNPSQVAVRRGEETANSVVETWARLSYHHATTTMLRISSRRIGGTSI